ncbi:MAG TPA: Trk system potassium transporter TrkA [Syntrophomonadaceae bacterium]|nr:Trk system potassium transporter TrkA [Syntrophomonadaceae bacterium]
MKCIIIGAGKVGFSIAQLLSSEDHDVTIIENNEARQKVISDVLDVEVVNGSGASWSVLESAGVKRANMVVAVTESDELNMIACLLAKQYGVKTTVARVRNTDYVTTPHFSPEALLGIDLIINPEQVTAMEIAKIVRNPEALNVDFYAEGKVQLVELPIEADSPVTGQKIRELPNDVPFNIVAVEAVNRQHDMQIPGGDYVIQAGDHIYLLGRTSDIPRIEKALHIYHRKIEHLTILGGGRTGYHLAHLLEKQKVPINIKIIEKDPKKAQEVSENLNHTLVINGDGSDMDLLEEENIRQSDMLVAVTDDDKINLLSSLMGKNMGIPKTIVKIKRLDVLPIIEKLDIDIVFNPRVLTAGVILKYIRRGDIISVTVLGEERAEMIELYVQVDSIAVNKKLKDIRFPGGSIIGAIVRGNEVIIPGGDSEIHAADRLLVFALPRSIHKVEKLFVSGGKKK